MSTTIVVPQGLGYTAASVLSIAFLLVWQTALVGKARGRAKIEYPQAYAEKAQADASLDAKKFNCVQRAHQNTLEFLPFTLIATAITAVRYPILAAAGCGIFTFSRILYTVGYASGNPSRRSLGAVLGDIDLIGLLGVSCKVVYDLIRAGV